MRRGIKLQKGLILDDDMHENGKMCACLLFSWESLGIIQVVFL